MSKLIDLLIEWSKQKKRWPLLMILLVPGYFALFQSYYRLEFRQTLETRAFLWLSALTITCSIVLFILLTNYERVTYSRLLDLIRKSRRVSITKDLAWQTLTYDEGTGAFTTVTIVKELALTLSGLKIHPVVIPQLRGAKPTASPRDDFIIHGLASPVGLLFRSLVPSNEPQIVSIASRFMGSVSSGTESVEHNVKASVPLNRVFDVQSLIDMYVFEISVPSELSIGQRTAMVRMFLRHALMAMLLRDENPEGRSVARSIVDIGMLLTPIENEQLAQICKSAAIYLLMADENSADGPRALQVARKFAPNDPSIIAMQAILSLDMNSIEEAATLIDELQAVTKDQALLSWLEADYLVANGQSDEAIAAYERAIALEDSEDNQRSLHFNAAFAYAMAKRLKAREQGDGIIRHFEDAIQSEDNLVYHALKGYGWALRGESKQFEAEFAKVALLLKGVPESVLAQVISFVENWRARGLRLLKQSSRVTESVSSIIGSIEESTDVANLIVLTGAALDLVGADGTAEHLDTAERCINRVIELQPANGEAFKYRGLIYLRRWQNTSAAEQSGGLSGKARENLLKSIRLGHEMPETHAVLAHLYEADDDHVNAAKHRRRWLELTPDDPDAISYQAISILEETGDLATAATYLDGLGGKGASLGKLYRMIAARAVTRLGEGDNRIPTLERAKECFLKAIHYGDKAGYGSLAAILAEQLEFSEAIEYQRLALESNSRDADELVFLGALLVSNNEPDKAREVFQEANQLKPDDLVLLERQAMAWQAAGLVTEATATYINWLKVDPTSSTANSNLAFILFDRDDHAAALQHWENALRTSPEDGDATAGKAAALHALGRDDEARSCYLAAVSLNPDFLDESVMRTKYSWSDKAIGAVKEFIVELGGKTT